MENICFENNNYSRIFTLKTTLVFYVAVWFILAGLCSF
jgi:hypothetical protein